MTSSPETAVTLAQKFQAFYELFTEFTQDAAEMHANVSLRDDASRVLYNSLSRAMAFSDQLNLLVSLMREDVRLIDELTTDAVRPKWTDEIEHSFYDWLKAAKSAAPNVH